jgi:hypothetical protein
MDTDPDPHYSLTQYIAQVLLLPRLPPLPPPLPPRRRRKRRRSPRRRMTTWDSASSTSAHARGITPGHVMTLADSHLSCFRVKTMALTPASRPKIVKKRTKKFIRHQSDRYDKLKRNWRKPKVRYRLSSGAKLCYTYSLLDETTCLERN